MPISTPDGRFASQWDALWLGGAKMPGIATLGGDGIKRKLDVKRQKGKAGASIEDQGDDPAKFHATLFLWNGDLLEEFESIKESINPRKRGGKKFALDLYHPAAAFLGIDRVYLTEIGMPEHDKKQGTIKIRLEFIEWFPEPPPQKVGGGLKTTSTSTGSTFADDVVNGILDGVDAVGGWVNDRAADAGNAIANFFTSGD